MENLNKYKETIEFYAISAITSAAKKHLFNPETNRYHIELLDNPQREINNTTCAEAFVQTFKDEFITNATIALKHEPEDYKKTVILNHHNAATNEIVNLVSQEVLEKGAQTKFNRLIEESFNILNTKFDNIKEDYSKLNLIN